MAEVAANSGLSEQKTYEKGHIKYTTVKGFFLQDEDDTDSDSFDYVRLFAILGTPFNCFSQPFRLKYERWTDL
jgi:hypothetical protein